MSYINKENLHEVLKYEFKLYFKSRYEFILSLLRRDRKAQIWKLQKDLRRLECIEKKRSLKYAYYSRRINRRSLNLGMDIWHSCFDRGLVIYHSSGIVINYLSRIGKNCQLHGNNCIGNDGIHDECPIIGDNCDIGFGAIIIGKVRLGNNVRVAANAVVNKTFNEDNILLAGVPARIVKYY